MHFNSVLIVSILSASAALGLPQASPRQQYQWNVIDFEDIYANDLYQYAFNVTGAGSSYGPEFNTFCSGKTDGDNGNFQKCNDPLFSSNLVGTSGQQVLYVDRSVTEGPQGQQAVEQANATIVGDRNTYTLYPDYEYFET